MYALLLYSYKLDAEHSLRVTNREHQIQEFFTSIGGGVGVGVIYMDIEN